MSCVLKAFQSDILLFASNADAKKAGETVKTSKFQKNGRKQQYRQKNRKENSSKKKDNTPAGDSLKPYVRKAEENKMPGSLQGGQENRQIIEKQTASGENMPVDTEILEQSSLAVISESQTGQKPAALSDADNEGQAALDLQRTAKSQDEEDTSPHKEPEPAQERMEAKTSASRPGTVGNDLDQESEPVIKADSQIEKEAGKTAAPALEKTDLIPSSRLDPEEREAENQAVNFLVFQPVENDSSDSDESGSLDLDIPSAVIPKTYASACTSTESKEAGSSLLEGNAADQKRDAPEKIQQTENKPGDQEAQDPEIQNEEAEEQAIKQPDSLEKSDPETSADTDGSKKTAGMDDLQSSDPVPLKAGNIAPDLQTESHTLTDYSLLRKDNGPGKAESVPGDAGTKPAVSASRNGTAQDQDQGQDRIQADAVFSQPESKEDHSDKNSTSERKTIMPNTSDIKVWKDILTELQSNSEQNEVVIQEIQEEISLQEQRNKLEVKKLYEQIKEQTASLEKLLQDVKKDTLFTLPADEPTRESFIKTLEERLENSRQLMDYTASLLDTQTTAPETIEKIRFGSRSKKANGVRAQFPRQALLGNWIHYFTRDMFTCQCFWDDGEFKEYDFRDNRLVEERNGKFHVDQNKVVMDYDEGKQAVYTVTGYSDDCLDYLINKTPIRFDYMPEDLLNTLLEENAR